MRQQNINDLGQSEKCCATSWLKSSSVSRQRAASFAQSLHITYPIWLDSQQQYGRTYIAIGLPTTVIIDRSGVPVPPGFDGPLTYAQMKAAVAPLIRAQH